jgi:DNA-binding transcriptional LysR family regulator
VLPQWCLPESPAWAVLPGRRLMPARTRVFLEMLDRLIEQRQPGFS